MGVLAIGVARAETSHTVVVPVAPPPASPSAIAPTASPSDPVQPSAMGVPAMPSEAAPAVTAPEAVPQIIAEPPPPPAHPVVAAVRAKLEDPAWRKGVAPDALAALETFYGERAGPPLWITDTGFSAKAQAAIKEIQEAGAWGLSPEAFDLPSAFDVPTTVDEQASGEIKLSLAVLKYARHARGGRLTPSRVSPLFDQKPNLRDPKTVLAEIEATDAADGYLRSLHPKHAQFEQLRQALLKARGDPYTERASELDIQRLLINMERWRWMPPSLGAYHVWNNVPEFNVRIVKGGRPIYEEKTIVGQLKYATPIFSASMRSIVFHPDWTVPPTIIREDLQPALQQSGGFFGGSAAVLQQHNLRVSFKGQPVDANRVDWRNVNIREFTFTQPPGPANVLGKFKFNFPNKHAVYMHDTPQRELFSETVRTLSHGCIRVHQPDRLATILLAEDKGWSQMQVETKLAGGSSVVTLNRPVPVHITYFTATAGERGNVQTVADIYGLDGRTAQALFGNAAAQFPPPPPPAPAVVSANQRSQPSRRRTGDPVAAFGGAISGLFGN
ncbi:MAG: L,D-transpeptidase family protein [Methyloceanibacter sp.]